MDRDSIVKKTPLVIFSGPSGVGKGTVERLLFEYDELRLSLSCSATTRKPREGEINGIHYYFYDKSLFQQMIKGREFIEFSYHFDNYYGTLYTELTRISNRGMTPMLEIETRGAKQVIQKLKDDPRYHLITIFLLPPSIDDLKNRILKRGSEDIHTMKARLHKATEEIAESSVFKYKIINDIPERAANEIKEILYKELGIKCND